MRSKFDMQLEGLKQEMTTMGMLCENAIAKASHALLNADLALARELPEGLNQITQKERDIEAICLRLLLHQQLSAELLDHASVAVVLHEGIVLLGRAIRQRLEPVCIVGDTLL